MKNADAAPDTLRRLTKGAIDQGHTKYAPNYLLILGATDVVPMQELVNPMNADEDAGNDDDDLVVPSDLP